MPDPAPLRCNCFALRAATRHVTQFYDSVLAPLSLRTTQFAILTRLQMAGSCSINVLADRLVMDRTTLGRNIRPLAREGLLTIGPDAGDRRTRALAITPKGAALVADAKARWEHAQKCFEVAYGATQSASLRAALRDVTTTRF